MTLSPTCKNPACAAVEKAIVSSAFVIPELALNGNAGGESIVTVGSDSKLSPTFVICTADILPILFD